MDDFKIKNQFESFMSLQTSTPYTYRINMPKNMYREQPIHEKRTRKRLLKKPLCPRCQRKSHPILECPYVRPLNEKCTMLFRTLTLEQVKEVQDIINKIFPEAVNDKDIPEALEFLLAVLKDVIQNGKKKEEKEIVHFPFSTMVFPREVRPVEPQKKRTTIDETLDTPPKDPTTQCQARIAFRDVSWTIYSKNTLKLLTTSYRNLGMIKKEKSEMMNIRHLWIIKLYRAVSTRNPYL
ncbi:hypothetical protein C2G38_2322713 [Gigaspora rosea]|uniref:Uncharacterized protein n=1 Tax=Gigaspora rosea TaxID=44941 RepID=A0A397W1I8_9GLOM|nr:hypothetical protein C2G38_2322713 [Gigaspora rosea]